MHLVFEITFMRMCLFVKSNFSFNGEFLKKRPLHGAKKQWRDEVYNA